MDDTNAVAPNLGVNNSAATPQPAAPAGTTSPVEEAQPAVPQSEPATSPAPETPTESASSAPGPAFSGELDLTPSASAESAPTTLPDEPIAQESTPTPEVPTQAVSPAPGEPSSSLNMELGPKEPEVPAASPEATEAAPAVAPMAESAAEQGLNIPPEIAAAKANIQGIADPNAQQNQAQTAPAAKKSPLVKIIIIVVAAVIVLVGGYFAYKYFVKGSNSNGSDQYFISE